MINQVKKKDGSYQAFDADKLNKWAEYAAKQDVSWSDLAFDTFAQLQDMCSTADIHQAMINACVSKKDEAHLKVAARLLRASLYKNVYGSATPEAFSASYAKLVEEGYWQDFLLSDDELNTLDVLFDPLTDYKYEYTSLTQFVDKYAISRYVDGRKIPVETPQLALMGISLALFRDDGLEHVANFYHIIKERKLNIATPIMAAARTGENGFASCFVTTAGDTLDSIAAGVNLAYRMTANRAGIGFEYDIRSEGDVVGNDKCLHAGKLPHYKMLVETIKAVTQGVRGGAATVSYNVLDPEIDDLLRLKNPTTPLDKRIPMLDFSLVMNNEFLKRAAKNEDWLLVSKVDEPSLHDSFYNQREVFPALLEAALAKYRGNSAADLLLPGIAIKEVPEYNGRIVKARDILKTFLTQRQETGRIYTFNVDNANEHTPFVPTVRQSNLCMEIALPTHPYRDIKSLDEPVHPGNGDGYVGLCFLLAIDVAKTTDEEYADVAYYACRALDNIITNMYYPYKSLESVGENFRSIGVGITNLAYRMALEGVTYSSEAGRNFVHRLAELHQYELYWASCELAMERGKFGWSHLAKTGQLVLDTYNKNIDEHHSQPLLQDWETLRAEINLHGLRFSVHSAMMPVESSSVWGYSTNSVYPVREGVVMKSRPEGLVPFRAPEYDLLKDVYELAWDIAPQDLYKIYGIIQKFTDQGISADSYIDFSKHVGGRVPMAQLMKDFFFSQKIGMKSHYYQNSRTENKHLQEAEADCESCKL